MRTSLVNLRLHPGCRQLKRRARCALVGDLVSGDSDVELEPPLGKSNTGELAMDSGEEAGELSSNSIEVVGEAAGTISKLLAAGAAFRNQRSCDRSSKDCMS